MTKEEAVSRLNKLHLAYKEAAHAAKPYGFFKTGTAYKDFLSQLSREFEIVPLDKLEKFEQLIDFSISLKRTLEDKNNAVLAQEYEAAAQLHDKAKLLIMRALIENGLDGSRHYFMKEGKIYFKDW